jgi:hypothetical protein
MSVDAEITRAVHAMMRAIEPPAVPFDAIGRRMKGAPARRSRLLLPAAAAAALLVLGLPTVAPGITQSIEAQIQAIIRWTPPPPAPTSVESAMRAQTGSLTAAQSRVDFTIVPPAALPTDVVSERIVTIPTGVYSDVTHRWSVGSPAVWFTYRRHNGAEFSLLADRFDPREGPPDRYVFEDRGERNGREILVKHENYTWRNGDQVMGAVAGEGLSAGEIMRIRGAMRGAPVTGALPHATIVKQYRLP